jgi:glycosyltransferase involved in cell wall biosynthesis
MDQVSVMHIIARMNIGGPAVEIEGLLSGLDTAMFKQTLCTGYCQSGEREFSANSARANSIEWMRISRLGRSVSPLGDTFALWALIREIRKRRPDIVHTHTAKAGLLGRLAARLSCTGTVVVHTYHGHLLTGYFSPRKTRAWIISERLLARLTDAFIAVGDRVRCDLLDARIGRAEDFHVIPSGIAHVVGYDRSEAASILEIELGAPIVTYVGRLTSIKRPDRLLEVIRRISGSAPNVTFLIVGGGEQREKIEETCRNEHLPVRFLGWSDNVDLVYSLSDIVLLVSDNEGAPLVLIEAAAHGIPVVSTDVGSVSEIVDSGVTGILTAAREEDLSRAVMQLLDESELRTRMGRAAQERIKSKFSPREFLSAHAELYESIVLTRRR